MALNHFHTRHFRAQHFAALTLAGALLEAICNYIPFASRVGRR